MKTALLVIATGEKYHAYVNPLLESAKKYFVEHDAIVWTDSLSAAGTFDAKFVLTKNALGYPLETLHRYHTMLEQEWLLRKYDQLFYCDTDMLFVASVGVEVFSKGLTATLHPGYVGSVGTPERNPDSTAMIPFDAKNKYFCGGFNGGRASVFLDMAQVLKERIDMDTERQLTAIWHDESHLNRYMYQCGDPEVILDPSYCYPENAGSHYLDSWHAAGINPTPKILALTKDGR